MKNSLTALSICLICSLMALGVEPAQGQDAEPVATFDRAWGSFVAGDLERSTKIVDEALAGVLPSNSFRARFLYLKAFLDGKTRERADGAIDSLQEAINLYQDDGNIDGVWYVKSALAKHYLDDDRLVEAGQLLTELEQHGENLGYIYSLYAELSFKNGQYADALVHAKTSLNKYQDSDDDRGIAQAGASVGLFMMLNGEVENGFAETLKSQKGIVDLADTDHYYYSLINTIIYHRCMSGNTPDQPVRMLKARLESQYDKNLEDMLTFAVGYACN